MNPDDYVATANRYAADVVAKIIPACKQIRRACLRHLDNLDASASPDYPFEFNSEAANTVCEFAEMLPHVKGEWAGRNESIRLEPWQCFAFCVGFG